MNLAKRPLPTAQEALSYAQEMVPKQKWDSITIEEGGTDAGGPGLVMKPCQDCWIISYDPSPNRDERLEERIWVEKATGVVVKMVLED